MIYSQSSIGNPLKLEIKDMKGAEMKIKIEVEERRGEEERRDA